jgi:heme oxygenase
VELATTAQPIALALREATKGVHERLGRALPLNNPELTLDAYRGVIEALYGFHAPLEMRLSVAAAKSDGLVPMLGREKLWRLRQDLRALGSTDERIEALPRCTWVPEISTVPRAFGCLYVIEGATLGGRVVARAVREHLGLGPSTGASFFEGYGAATGTMWRSFLDCLKACTKSRAEVVEAAMDTFAALERWLSVRGVLR